MSQQLESHVDELQNKCHSMLQQLELKIDESLQDEATTYRATHQQVVHGTRVAALRAQSRKWSVRTEREKRCL